MGSPLPLQEPHVHPRCPLLPSEDKLWLKPYVDLQAYEDPAQGALDFTQELDPGCLIVDTVIGEGEPHGAKCPQPWPSPMWVVIVSHHSNEHTVLVSHWVQPLPVGHSPTSIHLMPGVLELT